MLNIVLRALGLLMATAARLNPRLRTQLAHKRIIEVRVENGPGRQFIFGDRAVRSRSAGNAPPDASLVFASSGLALRSLLSPRLPQKIMAGLHDGEVRLEGDALPLLWFMAFAQQVFPIRSAPYLPATPPDGYVSHTASASVSERIPRLGIADSIDPELTDELACRADLRMMRGARGEMLKF